MNCRGYGTRALLRNRKAGFLRRNRSILVNKVIDQYSSVQLLQGSGLKALLEAQPSSMVTKGFYAVSCYCIISTGYKRQATLRFYFQHADITVCPKRCI